MKIVEDEKKMSPREQIIQTVCELIENQGYHATGLNEMLKASGERTTAAIASRAGGRLAPDKVFITPTPAAASTSA